MTRDRFEQSRDTLRIRALTSRLRACLPPSAALFGLKVLPINLDRSENSQSFAMPLTCIRFFFFALCSSSHYQLCPPVSIRTSSSVQVSECWHLTACSFSHQALDLAGLSGRGSHEKKHEILIDEMMKKHTMYEWR